MKGIQGVMGGKKFQGGEKKSNKRKAQWVRNCRDGKRITQI